MEWLFSLAWALFIFLSFYLCLCLSLLPSLPHTPSILPSISIYQSTYLPSIHPFISLSLLLHVVRPTGSAALASCCVLFRAQVSALCLAGGARGPGAVQQFLSKFSPPLSAPASSPAPHPGQKTSPLGLPEFPDLPPISASLSLRGPAPPWESSVLWQPSSARPGEGVPSAVLRAAPESRARLFAGYPPLPKGQASVSSPVLSSETGWSFLSLCLSRHAPEIKG